MKTAPQEPAIVVTGSMDAAITESATYTEYRDAAVKESSTIVACAYPDRPAFEAVCDSLATLSAIEKEVVDVEAAAREPVNKWLKKIRGIRDTFLAPVMVEKLRMKDFAEKWQLADRKAIQAREAEAQRQLEAAAKAEEEAKKKLETASNEDDKLKAELEMERAALTVQTANAALSVPADTVKGTRTRISFDFEIVQPVTFIRSYPQWFVWKKADEQFHVDRKGLLKALNAESGEWSESVPPTGQDSVTHNFGLRVFIKASFSAKR